MRYGQFTQGRLSSDSPRGNLHDRSFNRRIVATFAGSGFVFLMAGGFALYLMNELGTAVEKAIDDMLPKTLVAMRLSEHSALLAASAPSLTSANDPQETERVATWLDQLKTEIDDNLTLLLASYESGQLQQIRQKVATLSDSLSALKTATNERIDLDERHSAAITRVHAVHSEFSDTVSPVVWGVASLTRLFGKRTSRANSAELKAIHEEQLERLVALMELQLAYRDKTTPQNADTRPIAAPHSDAFIASWQRVKANLENHEDVTKPVAQQLLAGLERLQAMHQLDSATGPEWRDPAFELALAQALTEARDGMRDQFASTLMAVNSSITDFVEQSISDMEYALNIKAEGNLLFALLTAVADADHHEGVSQLQERFRRSLTTFLGSANDFLNGLLSQRNPILAGNVENLAVRLKTLGNGPNNLFDIRRQQLQAHSRIAQLLANNRSVAAQLNLQVEGLVGEIEAQANGLASQLDQSRGTDRMLLVMVFFAGLLMLALIAYFSIRILGKQDREIRQAAIVFESTGEGVVITDSRSYIVAINQAFSDQSGYGRNELIGRHISLLKSKRHSRNFYRKILKTLATTGRWEGEIYTRNKFGESKLEWLTVNSIKDNNGNTNQYVAIFSDVEIVKRSLQKLDHLAHHDALTDLPNRLLLQDRIEHAIHRAQREQRKLAILFLDLDRFKNINDTLGHSVGDSLLQVCAERLAERIREEDTVARLGGDEFMILLEDYRNPEDARTVAQNVLDSLAAPIDIDGHQLYISASIGISQFPDNGATVEELVSNADAAMYRAKEKGKNNYQFYTADLTAAAREDLLLESSLRKALERNEFILHYQPKWDIKSARFSGVEALLRWQHPEQGLIGPENFIGKLEECGLIMPVGKWVLDTACAQAKAWSELGIPPMQMSVNLSGQQIASTDLLQTVTASCEACGFDPNYLELELTEGFIMQQRDEVVELLKSLRERGISIAIDDFGTGYSSLSYLKQLPIQKLKIDRSFVRDIPGDADDVAITRAIIALGHRLQMSIIAEGVETEEQLAFLTKEGCQEAQGLFISEPLPEEKIRHLLLQTAENAFDIGTAAGA